MLILLNFLVMIRKITEIFQKIETMKFTFKSVSWSFDRAPHLWFLSWPLMLTKEGKVMFFIAAR